MSGTKNNYWIKSGIINILQNFSGTLINLAIFFVLVRLLTKNDYGVWGIFLQTVTILEIIRNGLIQSALIKFMSGSEKKEHSDIFSATLTISGSLTVLCILLNLIFAGYLSRLLKAPELEPMFHLYNIVFIFSGILTQFNCIEQANFKYTGVLFSGLARQSVLCLFLFVCLFFGIKTNLMTLVYVQILAVLVSIAISWAYVKNFISFSYRFSKNWISRIFHYGKYAFATSVSSILSGTIDQWMLAGIISPAASGSFNIAVRIGNLIDIPTNAVATIVFPQSSKRIETEGKEAIKYLYEKSVGTILAMVIPAIIFIYLFDGLIIKLLAGDKYADTVPILNITLLYCIFGPFGRQFGVIIDSIGKTRVTFIIVIVNTCVILTLNYFLIHRYGVIGAAYATLIANIFGFSISQVILWRELKVNALNAFVYAYRFYPEFINKYILKKADL
ncbi:Membrane protein involved in the export of O-antigen and teichoic acid [Pedobacter suwonensis]|uniref:Membrane protein involved in the export of O-antigen and teichoic acid n=1 Tax=Pedobacter suwonensis TaxID=332999 RepID=A0A1I0SU72_9SPHI|nr:flippase [Pedobacter suwonensis]SFA42316.1 Membrane protein involved in the export of O-antigen and teichoic acid [Pedobacter suwonensis]